MTLTLMCLAKSPTAGTVKTRLCPPCSPEQAAALAEAALADTLDVIAAVPARRRVLVLDGEPMDWLPDGFEIVPQAGGGLAARLAAAFAQAEGPALVVGMDTPQLPGRLLEDAGRTLDGPGVDAVIGAAADGGYWAIGLRRPDPAAFAGVPMSTPFTARAQRARLRALSLRWRELPELRDVDTFEDARAVAELCDGSRFATVLAGVMSDVDGRVRAGADPGSAARRQPDRR